MQNREIKSLIIIDLIETLWNVKGISGRASVNSFRFNRDIVECKDNCIRIQYRFRGRFNRDIVECKAKQRWTDYVHGLRFNRDIVECKVIRQFFNIAVFKI